MTVTCFAQDPSTVQPGKQESSASANKFWGNSTYFGASINFARKPEFEFAAGRTYGVRRFGDRGVGYVTASSWGAAYSRSSTTGPDRHAVKAFYERDFLPWLIFPNYNLRAEYIYNFTDGQTYLRPSIGLSAVNLTLTYNYSFLLSDHNAYNIYRHGIAIRVKYFTSKNGWKKIYTGRHYRPNS